MSTISTPFGYQVPFVVPQTLAHRITKTRYVPLYRLWRPLESLALYQPFRGGDVLHSYNAIPLFRTRPWVVTFESRLPRIFGNKEWLGHVLRRRLLGKSCLAVLAMSQWAANLFRSCNRDWRKLASVLPKLRVLHPTVPIRSQRVRRLRRGEPIRLLFVGNDFARKGGVVAVRLAKRAAEAGIPLTLDVVSAMQYANGRHSDYHDPRAYDNDMALLKSLPHINFHGARDNNFVLNLMEQAHLTFLATLHETYGFSIIEGFSCGTPAITSNVCAQPEINDSSRGIILRLPTDASNCWTGSPHTGRPDYWDLVNPTYDHLAAQALDAVESIHENPEIIERLSLGAIDAARTRHNPATAAAVLNQIYAGAFEA